MTSSPSAEDLARLLEEAEREARRDAEADVRVAPAPCGRAPVGGDLRGLGADLEEEAALVGGLAGAEVLDLDRVRGDARLVVEDLDLDEVRAADLGAQGQAPHDGELAQRQLAHDAAHDDEREEHAEQQVQEVVGGVDRGEADAQRDADEELPFARELEAARRAHAAAPAADQRTQRAPSGRCGAAASGAARSERHGDARDDLAHGGLRLVARGDEAVGVGREPDAVREDRHGEVVDVVGDAVVASAQEARARAPRGRAPWPRAWRAPSDSSGDVRVATMSACR